MVQHPAAMLAVHGVGIVHQQAAIGTFELHLLGPEDRLQQAQEQPNPHHHDNDGQQPPGRPQQRHIAEAGRRQGGDGEVEGIDVAADLRIDVVLSDIDRGRHEEDEDAQIDRALDHALMASEPGRIPAQVAQQMV